MKFWDASAIVPLIVEEDNTDYCTLSMTSRSTVMNRLRATW